VFVCRLSLLLWAKRRAIQIRLHPSVLYGPSGRPPFVEARFPCPFSGSTIQRWIIRPAASEFLRRASQFWRYRHVVLSGSQTIDPNQWPADQRGLFERFIDHSRRLHVCRLSLMVAAVGLVLAAGSASAAHRSGFWGSRYCLQGQTYGYPGHCQFSTFQSCQASASGTPAGELTEIRIGVATRKLTADNTLQLLGAGLAVARAACRCGIA